MSHDLYRAAIRCVTEGRVSDLHDRAAYDTDTACAALHYALLYSHHEDRKASGYVSPAEARATLKAHECPEPPEAAQLHRVFMTPSMVKPEGSKAHWPINAAYPTPRSTVVWGLIVGIERGAFAYDRSGFLHWTDTGRDRFAAGDSPVLVEAATGQVAFAF